MTRILHRTIAHTYPVAARGQGSTSGTRPASDTSMPPAARRCRASAMATPTCWPPCTPSSTSSPMRTPASSPRKSPRSWAMTSSPTRRPASSHVYFVSGGSEAIEAALKMARQYFVEKGEPQRRHFIARRQSYHGNTLGALAVGGNEWRRKQFAPLLIETHHVSPCFEYRDKQRRRDAAPVRRAARAGARGQDRGAGPRDGDRLRRRDRRRRHGRRHPAGRGLFQARARDLRPPRHPADPRRGHVRHGPHRHAACLRAGGHRA